jgi:hypothetical protein
MNLSRKSSGALLKNRSSGPEPTPTVSSLSTYDYVIRDITPAMEKISDERRPPMALAFGLIYGGMVPKLVQLVPERH